ncbi:hypothetical protein EF913_28435 [Streptomyces sp. WAC04189]|uniref:WhiB family transcriptional regulator n=1 Tax=Streptomyces sp. WAC04189 TaxID=2487411 RepID=UPI000FC1D9D0|nr:WhiB family transcriptional regulator [Streptomyces sp. WAC04189]RSR98060.1 hypothetical protein EF913_28435 [Streptomyces sp. WAC04189]
MTTTISGAHWGEHAACVREDPSRWFGKGAPSTTALDTCRRCPVRPECLHDALTHEATAGIWGGLTTPERRGLPPLPPVRAEALDLLRTLIDQHDTERERTTIMAQPIAVTPPAEPPLKAVPVAQSPVLPVDKLLDWGERHVDPDVQAQASRARIALTGLRNRYASDLELNEISDEEEKLVAQLAELRSRKAALLPAKAKSSRKPDYPAAEVRAWAAANGFEVSPTGRVPRKVVDAWRAATQQTAGGS